MAGLPEGQTLPAKERGTNDVWRDKNAWVQAPLVFIFRRESQPERRAWLADAGGGEAGSEFAQRIDRLGESVNASGKSIDG